MSFFSDPEHIWLAVLTASGTTVASVAMFALVVKTMLDQFLRAQREILTRATIQTGSIDTALSLTGQRIDMVDERVTKLERSKHDHANKLVQLDERLRRVEPTR